MTQDEIEQALFALSGHDPQFREVGLTGDIWRHIERLTAALQEIAKGGTRPCDDEPSSARIAAAALEAK